MQATHCVVAAVSLCATGNDLMDLQSLLNSAKSKATQAWQGAADLVDTAAGSFGQGLGYARQSLGLTWLLGSNEVSTSQADEKHYFLIPFRQAESGYLLYSMRCLPDGVPPINDLPKKRIFHLPNEHSSQMIERLLCDEAASTARASAANSPTASRLADLADRIDELDSKAFNGALLIGGLVALANPVAGGMLAAKAMIPSVGLLLAKYGLKTAGETLDERSLNGQIKAAEKRVLQEFHGRTAAQVTDPLLDQLDRALRTDALTCDPLVETAIDGDNTEEFRLTATAITNAYEDTLADRSTWPAASLGPEDVRWLQLLKTITESYRPEN